MSEKREKREERGGKGWIIVFSYRSHRFLLTLLLPSSLLPSNDKRAAIKAAHPSWGIGEIGKELGAMWKKVSDADKEKYNKQAAKDKERYQKELAAYKPA